MHFSEERTEAGKHQGRFGVKWDDGKNGKLSPQVGAVRGGDGGGFVRGGDGGGFVRGGDGGGAVRKDDGGQLLQAPVTDMKAPPLR